MSSSDSSFSSSFFFSSAGASAAGAAPPTAAADAPTAGAPPPDPTFESSSLTFFPSRALARRLAQIGSSSTPAALVIANIFSDWELTIRRSGKGMRNCIAYSDIYAVVSKDEGCIRCGEFGGGLRQWLICHCKPSSRKCIHPPFTRHRMRRKR